MRMPAPKLAVLAAALAALAGALAGAAALAVAGHAVLGVATAVAVLALAALVADMLWVDFDPTGRTLRKGRRDRREVALTFDDGPGPDTPAVLAALEAAGVRATFFVLGRAAERWPEQVRALARHGHLVALHGHSHAKLHLASPRTIAAELDRGAAAVRAAGVAPAPYFRAPHGFKSALLRNALRRRGLALVGWTRGVWDTARPGAEAIAARACARMRGGEILLLHDGCGERPGDPEPGAAGRRDQTAAAVPEIVRRWRAAGYRFVTIAELAPAAPRTDRSGRSRRSRSLHLAGLAALAVLAAVALRDADLAAIGRALLAADPRLLALAAALNLAGLAAQAARWHALVRPIAPAARLSGAFRALVSGYALGLVLPARASDVARAHLQARASRAPLAALAATVVLDHAVNAITLLTAIGLFGLVAPLPAWARSSALGLLVASAGAAIAARALHRHPRPGPPRGRLGRLADELRGGLGAVRDPRALAAATGAALAGWALEIAIAVACLPAFGLPPAPATGMLLVLATTVSAAASVSPGNAGAFELAAVLALAGLDVPREQAVAFALGYHAVHLLPVALLGGAWLLTSGRDAAPGEAGG